MLKHEDNPELSSRPAAQARVTAEELAHALSRIEARKDAGQRNVDGTISIGEAVQQLGVDTTPEEVLAEVQAARAQRTTAKNGRYSHRQRLALVSCMGLGLIGFIGWWSTPHHAEEDQAATAMAINLSPPQAAPKRISLDPNLMVQDASNKLVTLSEVVDNQPVACDYSDGAFQPYSSSTFPGARWTLIKHGGKVYVRGRIVSMSAKVMQADGAVVATPLTNPPYVVRVTLPLNGFKVDSAGSLNDQFHAVNIRLDKHAYEKWQP